MVQPNNATPNKNVEFITLTENFPRYRGYCKLKLDLLSKHLIVDPYDESVKPVSASFEWNCILEAVS
uniref:Uncharacterized protein n=1 Tax=Panagrolaimus sp. ES5 TaxID=591445 RepID=A0AC34GUH6_9BILA